MKKIFLIFVAFLSWVFATEWYTNNKEVLVVFPQYIVDYIEKANSFDDKGKTAYADYYLRLALRKTEQVLPFSPTNWPDDWPQDREALKYLKYATPEGYLYRIVGDYALSHGKRKEAIKYFQMYLSRCVIPDVDYMMKLAKVFEEENLKRNAEEIYKQIINAIEFNNFKGKRYSIRTLTRKIKEIELSFRKLKILVLKVQYNNVPAFIMGDFDNMFLSTFKEENKNIEVINSNEFKKVLNEAGLKEEELEDEDDLSYIAKVLNADYVVKPILTRVKEQYIFEVSVFDPKKKIFFENYEFKTEIAGFLANLIERFCYKFQGKEIPSFLYLPENNLIWAFEADSLITDIKMADNGRIAIIGTENGTVYLLDKNGKEIKKFSLSEKVIKVSISPDGEYFAFLCMDGKVYFGSKYGVILWSRKLENYGRGVDIGNVGRFLVAGVNNRIYYMDKKGEIFWEYTLPDWINIVRISPDSHNVYAGIEGGRLFCFYDDGNVKWTKDLKDNIEEIRITGDNKFICVSTEKGKVFLIEENGNVFKEFEADTNINFTVFSPSLLTILTGKRGKFFYFLSYDKSNIWRYQLKQNVDFAVGLPDGRLILTVDRRNLFAFSITWR